MPKFTIPVTFTFSGAFKIVAEDREEAESKVEQSCAMTSNNGIHSDLSDDEVDWEFDVHPEKTISSVTPTFLVGASYADEETYYYTVEARSSDAAAVTTLVALSNMCQDEERPSDYITVSLVALLDPNAEVNTLSGKPCKLSILPPQPGDRIGIPYSVYRALRQFSDVPANTFGSPWRGDDYAAQFDATGKLETLLHRTPPPICEK
jgi:hypothetical protein